MGDGAGRALLEFLAFHVVAGLEVAGPDWYARTLDLAHGAGTARLDLDDRGRIVVSATWSHPADAEEALARGRRILGPPRPPEVSAALAVDPVLGPLVATAPGLRLPGQDAGAEIAVRTVIGQQVSVAGARTVTGRLVAGHGQQVETGVPGLTHLFPRPEVLAEVDPETLPMPRARGRALVALASALAAGAVDLDGGHDPADVRRALLALPGIGPWTADYVALRALGDADVFLPTDIGVRNAITRLGLDPVAVIAGSHAWQPWRSYALMHLWGTLFPRLEV